MLFAFFVISVLVTVGFAIYAGGVLFGRVPSRIESLSVPPQQPAYSPYVALPTPPIAPVRVARGTTPPPIPSAARAASPVAPGVVSNRDDLTHPEIAPDARFSVRRSRPSL